MSKQHEKTMKTVRGLAKGIKNIYDNTARFHWSHEELVLYYVKHVYEDASYQRLPKWAKSYLDGVRSVYDAQLWRAVVFSYEVRGKRLTIDSPKYRRVSASYVSANCADTGCYVYRDAPDKLFTLPKQARQENEPAVIAE